MTQLKCIAPDGTVVQTQKYTYNSKGYLQKEVVYEGDTKFLTVNYDKYTHGKPQRAVTNCIIAVKEKFLTTYEKEPQIVYDKINLWYEDNLAENRYFIPG